MRVNSPEGYAAVATALALVLGNTACGGSGNKSTCLGPRKESIGYPGNPEARKHPNDPVYWPTAMVARTKIAPSVKALIKGVVFSWEVPNSNDWNKSEPQDVATADAVLLRIGPGDVEFATQFVADSGSQVCEDDPKNIPHTSFEGPEPVSEAAKGDIHTLHWPSH